MRISDWSSDVCSSDLVLDHLGRLARVLGEHDHLDVRQIWLCVQWRVHQRIDAAGDDRQRHHQHQEDVADRPLDEATKHVSAPRGRWGRAESTPGWRTEERRVGKECGRKFRDRRSQYLSKKTTKK